MNAGSGTHIAASGEAHFVGTPGAAAGSTAGADDAAADDAAGSTALTGATGAGGAPHAAGAANTSTRRKGLRTDAENRATRTRRTRV
jgi:hypothetical protein